MARPSPPPRPLYGLAISGGTFSFFFFCGFPKLKGWFVVNTHKDGQRRLTRHINAFIGMDTFIAKNKFEKLYFKDHFLVDLLFAKD